MCRLMGSSHSLSCHLQSLKQFVGRMADVRQVWLKPAAMPTGQMLAQLQQQQTSADVTTKRTSSSKRLAGSMQPAVCPAMVGAPYLASLAAAAAAMAGTASLHQAVSSVQQQKQAAALIRYGLLLAL
jgi:hypothetical protein